ncbi:type II secretion system F family protein [Nocardioides sp. Leaf285]|uniref:type II secretion system F family protein n=1 Tax=Nocardioides sp. Leaf285 TaxID=1736322 RepID=UPI0007034881|nr:type II secretion system F family protein [Nocardioides sp. Leaf285]KQP63149.1 hypothetical protein ASF47_19255 [Nocardioides sp. Leaf285]
MATAQIATRGLETEVYSFTVRARSVADGTIVNRKAKAARRSDVVNALDEQGLVPLRISGGPGVRSGEIQVRKAAKHRALVTTTQMLSGMISARLTPVEAFEVLIDDCEDLALRNAMTEVRDRIVNGEKLSAAMASQPAFPPQMINFVVAGEAAGDLPGAFDRIAKQYDAEDRLRSKVKKALAYPIIVSIVAGAVFAAMMLYMVPSFAASFVDIGGEGTKLPLLTRAVVAISDVCRYAIPAFLVAFVPALLAYRANKHKDGVRAVVDPLKMKLPVLGRLFHKIALARFARNLSGLIAANVDRLEALEITAKTVGNVAMEKAVMAARTAQKNGQRLVDPLKDEPLFPTMIIKMIDAGERSGQTGPMLEKAADLYDRDVDQITDNMTSLIEPLFLVVLGGMIVTIVLAIYLPYLQLGTLI